MITALAPLFIGEFASYRDVLVTHDDPRPGVLLSELLEPQALTALLERFGDMYGGHDRRALASQWSKYYFVRLIPPVMAAALVLGRRMDVGFENLQVVLDAQGIPEAFKLVDEGAGFTVAPGNPFERFSHLLHDNLYPFIHALAPQAKLSPRVLWSNAGNYIEWFVGEITKLPLPASMLADGPGLLNAALLPDGGRNPLYQPIRYVEVATDLRPDGRWRQRKVCCLRYRLAVLGNCDNCPLLAEAPRLIE